MTDEDLDWIYDVEDWQGEPEFDWPISPPLTDVLEPEYIGKNKE